MSEYVTGRSWWGKGIALVYAAFATGTLAMVTFATVHPVDLVSADYYAKSQQYDDHMAAAARGDALGANVDIRVDEEGRRLVLQLPTPQASGASGTVRCYRASAAGEDRAWPLALDVSGRQILPLTGMSPGVWRVWLDWRVGAQTFYREQVVRLP